MAISMLAMLAMFVGASSASAQASTGTLTGRVTDGGSGAALASTNVRITGTQVGTQTDVDGKYTIRGVVPGLHDVQVNRIGYEAKHVSVRVIAGQTTASNVTLSPAAFSLATVVTTVTGASSKAEISNTVATVDVAAKVDESTAHSLGEMLSGQAAGVQISSAGSAGSGSRIRIRGQNSLNSNNAPVVYIDGVKVNSDAGSNTARSTQASRFDDINPEEIESIDILKGPAAATLYGTEAANGVILITTKKGKAGATRLSVFGEGGISHDPSAGNYRDLWIGYDNSTPGKHKTCALVQESQGNCHIDSLYHGNVLNQPGLTPIVNGNSKDAGLQVSGGSDRTQFFLSGEYNNVMGPYKMPQPEIARLTAERGEAPLDNQINPNADRKINLRTNLSTQFGSKADVAVSVGYLNRDDRQPPNEDNAAGVMVDAIAGSAATDAVDSRGLPLHGYRSYLMGDIFSQNRFSTVDRYTTSLNARFYPVSWLNMRANFGYDYTGEHTSSGVYFGQGPCCGTSRQGTVSDARSESDIYTIDLGATATTGLWRQFGSKLSVGTQAYRSFIQSTSASGQQLPPGATTVASAAQQSAGGATTESVTLGTYAEEVVSWADQLYVTGAVRYDGNSAFGKEFKGVLYPKIGASWDLTQASWFPKNATLSSLRLRSTYGTSGVQPGGNAATRYYTSTTATILGADSPGVQLASVGNPRLKPEFSAEWEGGFDATLFHNRTTFEFTYFNHHTSDALINRPLAPSLAGLPSVTANLGSVRNTGVEYTLNNRFIDNNRVGFELQLTGSAIHNRILTLGEGVTPVATGNLATQTNAPGYPLFGYWGKTYSYNDANGDRILTPNELAFSDTAIFIGSSYPTIELAANPRLELLHRKLGIAAQFDHKEGMIKFNNTLRHQCSSGAQSCRGLYDVEAGLAAQAVAVSDNSFGIYTGEFENGRFTRLREVSVSYQLPDRLAARVHSSRALLVVAGRNLHVWTPYTGVDPEATVGNGDSYGNEEFFSTPPLRFFTVRLNLTF